MQPKYVGGDRLFVLCFKSAYWR